MSSNKRTYQLCIGRIEELLRDNGMTLEDLARKSGVSLRTLRRKLKGDPAFPSTIRSIAEALATTVRDLLNEPDNFPATVQEESPKRFKIHLKLSGTFDTTHQKNYLIRLNAKIASVLSQEGIVLSGQSFTIATSHFAGSGALRLVIGVRGATDGKPSWFLASVKPAMLAALCQTQQIDANNFPFGEVLQSGWGREIPTSAIQRAAALLHCHPAQIIDAETL